MADSLKKGDRVEWHSAQGTITGTVQRKLTAPIDIKGHHVAASEDHPEYLVKSDKTGQEAAHKAEALKKLPQ
jgi:Hypervirulence associated proteins TUDOR domain